MWTMLQSQMKPLHVLIFFCILLQQDVFSLKILSVDVPAHVQIGDTAVMQCKYELGKDELYSVKWYKGKDEFYRYVPKDKPPGQVFRLKGVRVNRTASNNYQVVLSNVVVATSGLYRCEVSAEAPTFQTESESKQMYVIDPPSTDPTISGGLRRYRPGDPVHINCSTVKSSPHATLEWYINGVKATDDFLHTYPEVTDSDGLQLSILGLEFEVEDEHFGSGGLNLRCQTSLQPFYSRSSEHSINNEHHAASTLRNEGSISPGQNQQISRHSLSYINVNVIILLYSLLFR